MMLCLWQNQRQLLIWTRLILTALPSLPCKPRPILFRISWGLAGINKLLPLACLCNDVMAINSVDCRVWESGDHTSFYLKKTSNTACCTVLFFYNSITYIFFLLISSQWTQADETKLSLEICPTFQSEFSINQFNPCYSRVHQPDVDHSDFRFRFSTRWYKTAVELHGKRFFNCSFTLESNRKFAFLSPSTT